MLKNRVTYLIILAACGLFYICFNGDLSFYVLAASLMLPVLSLLLSLPGALGADASLSVTATATTKGRPVELTLTVQNRRPIVSGRARVTLRVVNTLTGERQQEKFAFTAGPKPTTLSYRLASPACGQVIATLTKGWVCDYMGLFALPLRMEKKSLSVLFYPAVSETLLSAEQRPQMGGEGERYSQTKPGSDPSEIFGFREYQPGDRISQIDWKMSPKTDLLMVREMGQPISCHLLFLLEPGDQGRAADTLLDVFCTLSDYLSSREIPHRVCFRGGDGTLQFLDVLSDEDIKPALTDILTAGGSVAPLSLTPEVLPDGGFSHVMYLSPKPGRQTLDAVSTRLFGARFTVFQAFVPSEDEEEPPQTALPPGAELVTVASGLVAEALHGFQM